MCLAPQNKANQTKPNQTNLTLCSMALRHNIPDIRPSLCAPVEMEKILPKMPAPVRVEFRSGADLSQVVQAVSTNKSVAVEAAVGAGKTTLLPYKLAADMSILVVHVFPNPFLACQVSDFCASRGKPSVFIERADQEFPDEGVVCVSAATLVAKWLEAGEAVLPRCVLFHDESHESDVYTYLVKSIVPALRVVKCYINATATSSGSGFRQMETAGRVDLKMISASEMQQSWDIFADKPWGIEELEGHMLIFEDLNERAEDLAQQYRMAGMIVHRFHSRMSMVEFRAAIGELFDPASPLVVIIADYSFRSGFTFPVTRIIDTGRVINVVMRDGRPIRDVRYVYELESYQAMGRGGRLDGQRTVYYRPDVEFATHVCDLEAAEVDAAALIFRLLGYTVPRQLASAPMAEGNVPRMLQSALRGRAPLAILQPVQKQPIEQFFTPAGRRSPMLKEGYEFNNRPADFENKRISADIARKHGLGGVRQIPELIPEIITRWDEEEQEQPLPTDDEWSRRRRVPTPPPEPPVGPSKWAHIDAREESRRDSAMGMYSGQQMVPEPLHMRSEPSDDHYDHGQRMNAVADTIRAFALHEDSVCGMDVGYYYHATGLHTEANQCAAFPDGYVSVCKWLSRDLSETSHLGLRDFERGVAVNALTLRYNMRTCEMRVLTSAIPDVKQRAVGKDLNALRLWATNMSETIVAITAELRVLSRYILRLVRDFCGLAEMSPMLEMEQSGHRKVLREVDKLPSAGIGPPTGMMDNMRRQWDGMSIGRASTLSDDSEPDNLMLSGVSMPTTGKGMRAIASPSTDIGYGKRAEYSIRKEPGRRYSLVKRRNG